MDRDAIVAQLAGCCKSAVETIIDDPDLHDVASASLALFTKFRDVAREILQAKVDLEAAGRRAADPPQCCEGAGTWLIHRRGVCVETLFGSVEIPVRTFRCTKCRGYDRPDDAALGVPRKGPFADDVREIVAPLVAELPLRVAADLLERTTGVRISLHGLQAITETIGHDVRDQRERLDVREDRDVARALREPVRESVEIGLEIAMDGVMAHVDGAWREAKVGTVVVRRVDVDDEETEDRRGKVLARRHTCVLGPPEELGARLAELIESSGWTRIPVVEVLGDGAPWIWNLADELFPYAHQTLDSFHLREHLFEYANVAWADARLARRWVERRMKALLRDQVGAVLSGLKRTRPRTREARDALRNLIRYVENNRDRVAYEAPWAAGFAIGSGSVEGACKHLVQTRFKRAGMRWKRRGFLDVLELRLARLNGTLDGFWRSARDRRMAA